MNCNYLDSKSCRGMSILYGMIYTPNGNEKKRFCENEVFNNCPKLVELTILNATNSHLKAHYRTQHSKNYHQ